MSQPQTHSSSPSPVRRAMLWLAASALAGVLAAPGAAQTSTAERPAQRATTAQATANGRTFTVPFSDPSRPGTLEIHQTQGSIYVEAYDGRDVHFELRLQEENDDDDDGDNDDDRRGGLRRFNQPSFQTEVTEEDNVMELNSDSSWSRTVSVHARVPRRTHLQLECVHSCDLIVKGVTGDHELTNTHGSIEALEVGGTVVASTTHGEVKVVFASLEPGRPMAFSSFHGDVDVTFPPTLKAEVRIDPGNHGEVYTAFDIVPIERPTQMREERKGKGVRVVVEREARGTINGGGPEISFKTWHGTIYIRKKGI